MIFKINTPSLSKIIFLVINFLCSILCISQPLAIQEKPIAINNVNLITMTSPNNIVKNATVVIVGNHIESINGTVPKNAIILNGKGKWLMPGLIDMHVHIPTDAGPFGPKLPTQGATMFFDLQDYMTLYNTNGVTTIFDLGSKAEHFGQRNEIGKGKVIGPRIALAAMIDGGEGQGRRVNTAEDGRQAVRSAKAEGYEFIKVYSELNIETYQAIIDEANKQDLKTIGHIPKAFNGKLKDAFVPNFGMVAHAEELSKHCISYNLQEAQTMAKLLKENGTWLCPTLTTMEWIASQIRSLDELKALPTLQYIHPLLQSKWQVANNYNKMNSPENIIKFDKKVKFHLLLVKACKEIGVPIVAGTDAGVSGVVAGFSLHDELSLLVKAGLTTEEALASATILSAQWLGIDKIVGTIEANKLADLVLLDENPLVDIKNAKKIAGVFINGKWLEKVKLNSQLADLSKRNKANRDNFDWLKMMKRSK